MARKVRLLQPSQLAVRRMAGTWYCSFVLQTNS